MLETRDVRRVQPDVRPDVRLGVRPDVWPDVQAAGVLSAVPKNKSFDRGGPVWPPRSNVTNDRLRGGSPAKIRRVWGAAPLSQNTGRIKVLTDKSIVDYY